MTHRRPISCLDRESLIAEAASAAHCWVVVCTGLLLIALLSGFVQAL